MSHIVTDEERSNGPNQTLTDEEIANRDAVDYILADETLMEMLQIVVDSGIESNTIMKYAEEAIDCIGGIKTQLTL